MQTSNISWTTYTWNPVTGCTSAGPECYDPVRETRICYAWGMSNQAAERESPPDFATDLDWIPENASEIVEMYPEKIHQPDDYTFPKGPGRVFVGSMTDMFHSEVDPEFTQRVLEKCRQFPEHVWIFLTKRPQNAADWDLDYPENVWLGTSVGSGPGGELPDTTHRIDALREVDAPLRWVSFEPLIERVGQVDLSGIDWAVVGGVSMKDAEKRREMEHEWARELLQQCREEEIAFYFKQSSGPVADSGKRITVYDEKFDVYGQQKIQEYPELPDVTKAARKRMRVEAEA